MIAGINTLKVKLYQDQDESDFAIWSPYKIDELNSGYEVKEYLPGYLAIGSDGGLEILTVHLQSEKVYPYDLSVWKLVNKYWLLIR